MLHCRCLSPAALVWLTTAVASLWFEQVCAVEDGDFVSQSIKYIWPTTTWTVPLTTEGNSLLDPGVGKRLARIGVDAFDKYVKEVLPLELKADPKFAEEFANSDASRINLGFARWQKRVYSELLRVPLDELSWDGSSIPHYPDVSYKWDEFYKSPEYKSLKSQIKRLSTMYLKQFDKGDQLRSRCFIWSEIYRYGDSHRPHVHTGASTAGVYFAKYGSSPEGAQKFAFEDVRGINPPFGKTHNHQPTKGEIMLFPSWASHFISPHRSNSTNVYFSFVCWPPDGAPELDWEDDPAGDYVYEKTLHIKKPKDSAKQRTEL